MKKISSYKILKKERLIVEYHSGDINKEDFIISRKITSDKEFNPNFDRILDFRDANLNASIEDVDIFVDFFKNYIVTLGNIKLVFLTDKPNETVITTLFSEAIKDLSIKPRIFSTISSAVNLIGNKNIDVETLNRIIEELKT